MAKWKDTFYVKAYQLARSGLLDEGIAAGLGITAATFRVWRSKRSAFRKAIEDARGIDKGSPQTFIEYVYRVLPPNLKSLVDQIEASSKEKNGIVRIEKLLANAGRRIRQQLFVHSLVASNFNVSRACSKVVITVRTFRNWLENDHEFAELMDEIHYHKKNYFEGGLFALVGAGDTQATIFANRTFNRDRGYNEKVEVEHTGQVDHKHSVSVDDLDLPIETRKLLLKAVREKKNVIDVKSNGNGKLVPVPVSGNGRNGKNGKSG